MKKQQYYILLYVLSRINLEKYDFKTTLRSLMVERLFQYTTHRYYTMPISDDAMYIHPTTFFPPSIDAFKREGAYPEVLLHNHVLFIIATIEELSDSSAQAIIPELSDDKSIFQILDIINEGFPEISVQSATLRDLGPEYATLEGLYNYFTNTFEDFDYDIAR